MKKLLLLFLSFYLFSLHGQTYQKHIRLANGSDLNVQSMDTDTQGNLYVMGIFQGNADVSGGGKAVSVMTINLQGHSMNQARMDQIAQVINAVNPDVVAVQEVENMSITTGMKNWINELGNATTLNPYYLKTVDYLIGSYGIGLLTKQKPIAVNSAIYPKSAESTDENRGYIMAEFADYVFLSTHMGLNAADRDLAAAELIAKAKSAEKITLLAGDFNAQSNYRAMITLQNNGYKILNNPSVFTYPSDNPTQCIDFVLAYTPDTKLYGYQVQESGIASQSGISLPGISDHLPVYVKLALNSGTDNNAVLQPSASAQSVFVAKYNSDMQLQWSKLLTGTEEVQGWDLRVDKNNKIYLAGGFSGTLDATKSFLSGTGKCAFFARLNSDGAVEWSALAGNQNGIDNFTTISPDANDNDNYYVGGTASGMVDLGNSQSVTFTATGSFIAKYNRDGVCQWVRKLDGEAGKTISINRLVLSPMDELYALFTSNATQLQVCNSTITEVAHTAYAASLARVNNEDGSLLWLKNFKGLGYKTNSATQRDVSRGSGSMPIPAAVDAQGNLVLALWSSGMRLEILNEKLQAEPSITDVSLGNGLSQAGIVFMKYSNSGSRLHQLIAGNNETARSVTSPYTYYMNPSVITDNEGNTYLGGYTTTDKWSYRADYAPQSRGGMDCFLMCISFLNQTIFARRLGGVSDENLPALALDRDSKKLYLGIRSKSNPMFLGMNNAIDQVSQEIPVESLAGGYNSFVASYVLSGTPSQLPTVIPKQEIKQQVRVAVDHQGMTLFGAERSSKVQVYTLSGMLIYSGKADSGSRILLDVPNESILLVKITGKRDTVILKVLRPV